MNTEPIHILSLGAGVQSSTLALMAAAGEVTPMPSLAVFADTQDEPQEVYDWLETLKGLLPFPVRVGTYCRLSEHLRDSGHSEIPAFFRKPNGSVTIGKRQCTRDWKVNEVIKATRAFMGMTNKRLAPGSIIQWIGISVDEVSRAKDSRDANTINRFPLLEKRMSRRDCLNWLKRNGFPEPPKSACVFCPFKDRNRWRMSKKKGGPEWDLILKVSNQLARHGEFLTSDCLPIEQVDFSTEEERGQLNMFNNECEGMCGV
jgi:hypothetical protein